MPPCQSQSPIARFVLAFAPSLIPTGGSASRLLGSLEPDQALVDVERGSASRVVGGSDRVLGRTPPLYRLEDVEGPLRDAQPYLAAFLDGPETEVFSHSAHRRRHARPAGGYRCGVA